MPELLARVPPAILLSPLFAWDWHRHSHHHSSGDADFDATLARILVAVVVLFACGVGFTLAGLVHGSLVFALLGKRGHLFWAAPAVNVGLYFPVRAYLLPAEGPLTSALLGIPVALLCGLLAAAFLAPFLTQRWREATSGLAAEGNGLPDAREFLEPLPPGEPWWPSFRHGLRAPWQGFAYLCRYPHLWRYGVVPVLFSLLITAVVLLLLLTAAASFITYLHPQFPAGLGWLVLEVLCGLVLLLLALGLALVVWAFLQGVLVGHYQGLLARAVELQLGLRADQLQEIPWSYEIADACRDAAALVAINGGFLLLHLVPVVGSVAGVAGSLYFDCLLFGSDYLDYPLALRGKRRQEKKVFTRRHRPQTLGLGAAVFLANFVPVLGAVLLTTAVVGAVLLHRRLEAGAAIDVVEAVPVAP